MRHHLRAPLLVFAVVTMNLILTVVGRAEVVQQILVKVNGEIFTKTELEARQVALLRQRGEQLDIKTASDQQLRKVLDEITPRLMADAVDEMLTVQRGKELGYTMTDEQFKGVVDNIKRENKLETDDQFQNALKSENLTLVDLRRSLERQMIIQRVQQNEVMGRIGVTEDEARAYYASHLNEFTGVPSVLIREILIATTPNSAGVVSPAVDEKARDTAEQVRTRAQKGEAFDKLVAEVSQAPSKGNAGLIGPISLDDLSMQLRDLLEPLKVGDVSPMLRTDRGYQFFKIESSTAKDTVPYVQARDQANDRVFASKRKEQLQKYLEKLRSQAIIEWKNLDVKKAWEEGVKQVAAAPGP